MSLFQMSVAGGVLILFIVVIRALAIHRLPKQPFVFMDDRCTALAPAVLHPAAFQHPYRP